MNEIGHSPEEISFTLEYVFWELRNGNNWDRKKNRQIVQSRGKEPGTRRKI